LVPDLVFLRFSGGCVYLDDDERKAKLRLKVLSNLHGVLVISLFRKLRMAEG
jgi:hypothetical protein